MVQIKGVNTRLVAVKDALVLCLFEDDLKLDSEIKAVDKKYAQVISTAIKEKKFKGSSGQIVPLYLNKIILVGLGKKKNAKLRGVSTVLGGVIRSIRCLDPKSISVYMSTVSIKGEKEEEVLQKVSVALQLGLYQYLDYKTKDLDKVKKINSISFVVSSKSLSKSKKAISDSVIMSEAVMKARDLINTPPNVAVPSYCAAWAKKLSRHPKIKCTVHDEKWLKKNGMNCFIAVGQASDFPPRMVVMEYNGGKKGDKPIVIIGKGITFDTGGINTKPASAMSTMKFDKAGACSVLHIVEAAAKLGLGVNLVGIGAFAENAVAGNAYKPDDVLKSHSGITVEVLHSDAEGRMVLCDSLAYAAKKYKPKAMIDLATLTGAAIIATGYLASPIMGTDQNLIDSLKASGESSFDRIWQLPLWDEHDEIVKSDIADVKHLSPEMDAGTIIGAAFLKQFVGKVPWAHIDIAATGWNKADKGYRMKGATGFSVLLLLDYLSKVK